MRDDDAGQDEFLHFRVIDGQLLKAVTESRPRAGSADATILDDYSVRLGPKGKADLVTVTLPEAGARLAALRLEALPDPETKASAGSDAQPGNRTRSFRPNTSASICNGARSGPSPVMVSEKSTPRSRSSVAADNNTP